jgi:HSP20 family molecular chaperone IbpA
MNYNNPMNNMMHNMMQMVNSDPFYSDPSSMSYSTPYSSFASTTPQIASPSPLIHGQRPIVPRVDITESDLSFDIYADLVGCTLKNIDVCVMENNQLVISGQKDDVHAIAKEKGNMEGMIFRTHERNTGRFSRTITLLPSLDTTYGP